MNIAFISDAANLQKFDRWREISRRLALGQPAEAEARALADAGLGERRGSIPGCMRAEVAPARQAPELAWRTAHG